MSSCCGYQREAAAAGHHGHSCWPGRWLACVSDVPSGYHVPITRVSYVQFLRYPNAELENFCANEWRCIPSLASRMLVGRLQSSCRNLPTREVLSRGKVETKRIRERSKIVQTCDGICNTTWLLCERFPAPHLHSNSIFISGRLPTLLNSNTRSVRPVRVSVRRGVCSGHRRGTAVTLATAG